MNYLFRIPRNIMMLMSRYLRGGFEMNLKKKIAISATALTVALSTAFPIAAAQSQPVKAVGIVLVHRVTAGEIAGGFALAGAAKLLNFMQRADEMDAAQYNHRANKINEMHLKLGAVFIYNKRGQILNKKSGWVPMGTILRRPKGLYTIKGKKYYYFGKGLFFSKSGTEPYRIPKKHISTAGENFANWFNWLRTR